MAGTIALSFVVSITYGDRVISGTLRVLEEGQDP